jgi:hypothetical protein
MATTPKDILYIEIDDEITAIIDKVRSSDGRIVALVLPKRATVLQSIVNIKLLKRSAENAKKHIVLITSEASLLPLAGAVGMHVASSLQSKPAIPQVGDAVIPPAGDTDEDFSVEDAADKPIGQLAGVGAAGVATSRATGEPETIELDNETAPTGHSGGALGAGAAASAAKKAKKDRKLAIPDFNKFRLGLIAGGGLLVGLLVFFYFAVFVLPAATITIETDSSDIRTNASLKLDPAATAVDVEDNVIPAKTEQKSQTGAQQVFHPERGLVLGGKHLSRNLQLN